MTPQPIGFDWWDSAAPVTPPVVLPSILPPNATPQEKEIESATWRLGTEGPAGVRSTWQPDKIATPLLPWLAWGLATDGWDYTQPEPVLRGAVQNSVALHRIKGTLEGFRRLSALYGATVVKVDRPPAALIVAPGRTQAQRDALLATYPQLRIQNDTDRRLKPYGSICLGRDAIVPPGTLGGGSGNINANLPSSGGSFLVPSIGRLLRAYLYQDGVQTELSIFQTAQKFVEVRMPAKRVGLFCGAGALSNDAIALSSATSRYYLISDTFNYTPGTNVRYKTAVPGLTPNYVYPDRLAVPIQARGMFTTGFVGKPLARSTADSRMFSVVYLFTGAKSQGQVAKGRNSFLVDARLGMPAYTAILRISFGTTRNKSAFGPWLRGALIPRDNTRLTRFLQALSWSKSARDKVLIDTACHQEVKFSPVLYASPDLLFGSMITKN